MSLNYAIRRIGDVVVLDLSGRIVFGQGAPHVLHELVREQINQGCRKIFINLKDLHQTDTAGLGALVSALSTVTSNGGTLRFCEANERLRELLRMTRLDTVLNVSVDEATAIEAFTAKHLRKSSVA